MRVRSSARDGVPCAPPRLWTTPCRFTCARRRRCRRMAEVDAQTRRIILWGGGRGHRRRRAQVARSRRVLASGFGLGPARLASCRFASRIPVVFCRQLDVSGPAAPAVIATPILLIPLLKLRRRAMRTRWRRRGNTERDRRRRRRSEKRCGRRLSAKSSPRSTASGMWHKSISTAGVARGYQMPEGGLQCGDSMGPQRRRQDRARADVWETVPVAASPLISLRLREQPAEAF